VVVVAAVGEGVPGVVTEFIVVVGVQNPQASAQCSSTKFLKVELAESKQAPLCTSVLHVTSSAELLQSAGLGSFVEFAVHIHNTTPWSI